MKNIYALKNEIQQKFAACNLAKYLKGAAYKAHAGEDIDLLRAYGVQNLFSGCKPHIYQGDIICGSIRGLLGDVDPLEYEYYSNYSLRCPERNFSSGFDHFAPDYADVLDSGVPGILHRIGEAKKTFLAQSEEYVFLTAMEISMTAFRQMILAYSACAESLLDNPLYDAEKLQAIAKNCKHIAFNKPESFAEALQLVWLCHTAFLLEGRYAMALGRIDSYLLPFYNRDKEAGLIDREGATQLLCNVFIKIYEHRAAHGGDDVVNICIGGIDLGEDGVNELSFAALEAVKRCNIPGPNLSARISKKTSDAFLDECLKVVGTGLGYPAFMNDEVNIDALKRYGYAKEDAENYCMVGCIENFIPGKQPPWIDGRFDSPKYLEYIFNGGKSFSGGSFGVKPPSLDQIKSMADFLKAYEIQLEAGAREHVQNVNGTIAKFNPKFFSQPFLSCFSAAAAIKGKDIMNGGTVYPSVYGAALMGIGTVSDSLAAIERCVFDEKYFSLSQLKDALLSDFEGYGEIQSKLLDAPKYGNNDDYADKYAVWYIDFLAGVFNKMHLPDGGPVYIALASNVSNIYAGYDIGATPDGRKSKEPLSDAASPSYGKDKKGATSAVLSLTKPDYRKAACGTVVNQKFSPAVFTNDQSRKKLLSLIRVYFNRGGQEMQINATSREILESAIKNPEKYTDLVVRVSGFSAFFVTLSRDVQQDILNRTQQA